MARQQILHSISIDEKKCIGCVACMKVCPTRAIRVRDGVARLMDERCVDCGECLRVCRYQAIVPMTTSTADLDRFKFTIALPSPVIYSQFDPRIQPGEILDAFTDLGFDYVYDEALMCEMNNLAIEKYLDDTSLPGPFISSSCPVVVRLIKRLFPGLCERIIPLEPPREISAKHLRSEISGQHQLAPEEIGIFHVSPCAAKMVSITYPETLRKSHLNGAIPISDMYHKLMVSIKKRNRSVMLQQQASISGIGIGWSIAGGEIRGLKYLHTVSVSGVYDTIEILKDVEAGKLREIKYLECLICPDGCIGGPLTVENRFIAKSNILRLIKMFGRKKRVPDQTVRELYQQGFFSFEFALQPRPFKPLDSDRTRALEKLQQKTEILARLPKIDCGVCGAPDCETFAEDIVRGDSTIDACIYITNERTP